MTITVKTSPGLKLPFHDNPRRYITDSNAVTVPDNAYYRQAINDGDLVVVPQKGGKNGKS